MSDAKKYTKNLEIQYLRGLAITLVIATHLPILLSPQERPAYREIFHYVDPEIGVDIFFVISGYLMGTTLLGRTERIREADDRIAATLAFWRHRFKRLFPAAFTWSTLTLIVGLLSRSPDRWGSPVDLLRHWAMSTLSLRNFQNATDQFGYYWSLSVENQFYFVLPSLWFALPRRCFWAIIAWLTVLSTVWRPGGEQWLYFRFDGLLWGLIVYRVMNVPRIRAFLASSAARKRSAVESMAISIVFIMATCRIPLTLGKYSAPLAISCICLFAALLVGLASLDLGFIRVPPFASGSVYWVGELSYSIYLAHIPVWLLIRQTIAAFGFERLDWKVVVPLGLTSTAYAAYLTYRFVEMPFYKGLGRGVANPLAPSTG